MTSVDKPRIEAAVREILAAIGEDPARDGLRDTPSRVARAYEEFFVGLTQDPAELRPTGGFVGSYGLITFDRGTVTDYRFQDVGPLRIAGQKLFDQGAQDLAAAPKPPVPILQLPESLIGFTLHDRNPWSGRQ